MRILHETDRDALLGYVSLEPEMNLFLIGDLENFGIESEAVSCWVHEERERWDFVILRYFRYFLLYSRYEDYHAEEAVAFLRTQEPECISGKTVLLEKIAPAFPQWKIDSALMSRCDRVSGEGAGPEALLIRSLEKEDVPEAVDLLSNIEEFEKTYRKNQRQVQIDRMREEMEQGAKYAMGGWLDGCLVSVASTSAENSGSAMIVGVATEKSFRGRGFASAVVEALCRDCFRRGKKYLCLFYDNPAAGRIYNRIGFRELGEYGMLR